MAGLLVVAPSSLAVHWAWQCELTAIRSLVVEAPLNVEPVPKAMPTCWPDRNSPTAGEDCTVWSVLYSQT